ERASRGGSRGLRGQSLFLQPVDLELQVALDFVGEVVERAPATVTGRHLTQRVKPLGSDVNLNGTKALTRRARPSRTSRTSRFRRPTWTRAARGTRTQSPRESPTDAA